MSNGGINLDKYPERVKKFVKKHQKEFDLLGIEMASKIIEAISKGEDFTTLGAAYYAAKAEELPVEDLVDRLWETSDHLEKLAEKAEQREVILFKIVKAVFREGLKYLGGI